MSFQKLVLTALSLALCGCSSLTPDISNSNTSPMAEYYRAKFNIIDNYYAGDYYMAEYYIGDTYPCHVAS
jgi:starvation-inducible outer membrane lipoprotein